MNYYILRGGQQYGPYTLADLQRYVASGNIVMTDMTRSDGMSEWVPVSQVIGNVAVPQTPAAAANVQPGAQPPAGPYAQPYAIPAAGYPGYGAAATPAATGPVPPNLHWVLVLVLSFVTCGLFGLIWAFVEAAFMKKIKPECNAIMFYGGYVALIACAIWLNIAYPHTFYGAVLDIGAIVLYLIGAFSIKGAMEEYYNSTENINLRLSGVMTFFFNTLYFQYHFSRIHQWKTTGVLTPQG
jgi:hypothetical protein